MTHVEIIWRPFLPVHQLPENIGDLKNPGVYVWKVALPENSSYSHSYYIGSSSKRWLDERFWEHLRDTLGFLYFIRDSMGEWIPEKSSIRIDQFWDRINNIQENQEIVLDYIRRLEIAWAPVNANYAIEAEATIYCKLKEDQMLLDNSRAPIGRHSIHNIFLNRGSADVVRLLGEYLDFRGAPT